MDSYVRQLGGDSVDEPSPVAVEQGYQGIGPLVGLFPGDGRRFTTKPVDTPEELLRNAEEPAVEVLVGERRHGGPKAADGKGLDAGGQGDGPLTGPGDGGRRPMGRFRIDEVAVNLVRGDDHVVPGA